MGTLEGSREMLRQWWRERVGAGESPAFDNGSGLSREERITAHAAGAAAADGLGVAADAGADVVAAGQPAWTAPCAARAATAPGRPT